MKKNLLMTLFFLTIVSSLFCQVYKDPNASVSQRVDDLLSRMSLAEKIGQMTQANLINVTANDVRNYYLGSVLSGGGSVPGNNTPQGWADMYDNLQNSALSTSLGIPIIYGVDAVHGHNNVQDAVIFPHNIGLGAANDPVLMEQIGQVVALEVAATGVDWSFGPCVTVPRDERWGRTYEGFAEDPSIHDNLVRPFIRGFQGQDMQGEHIVACAKHFIGDGGTDGGVNAGNMSLSEAQVRAIHLPPYLRAIEENAGTVMISYNSWNGTLCHGNSYLITDLLKGELGFQGFVVSDWNAIRDLSGTYRDQIKTSVNAGIDMFMTPEEEDWQDFISNLTNLVNSGDVSQSRIDDAVRRILRIKFMAGLFENPLTDRSLMSSFGSSAHRQVAREAVRKSLVLLKNEGVLPISKNANIMIAGGSADSMRKQCGGWTIGWQGIPPGGSIQGTTILQGIRNATSGNVTYNSNGSGAGSYDVAIVVVGEEPYAEGMGDDQDLALSSSDIQAINNVESSGTPYVIVLVSGRPMIVTSQINNADSFIAAWLPGTEGDGVADCLFGDYDFTGKLSFTWPRDMGQIPINQGDSNYNPLYAFGYGLTLGAATATPTPSPTPTGGGGTQGDVNSDGTIDIIDALLIAQYYVGLNPSNFNPDVADVDCSGSIDIVDALLVAQLYVGLISSFPC